MDQVYSLPFFLVSKPAQERSLLRYTYSPTGGLSQVRSQLFAHSNLADVRCVLARSVPNACSGSPGSELALPRWVGKTISLFSCLGRRTQYSHPVGVQAPALGQ